MNPILPLQESQRLGPIYGERQTSCGPRPPYFTVLLTSSDQSITENFHNTFFALVCCPSQYVKNCYLQNIEMAKRSPKQQSKSINGNTRLYKGVHASQ